MERICAYSKRSYGHVDMNLKAWSKACHKKSAEVIVVCYPQCLRWHDEKYVGVQTYLTVVNGELKEMQPNEDELLEQILSPQNMNIAYKKVLSNKGCGGVDKMQATELLPYLKTHGEELISSLYKGTYVPNPVKRVEIPKDNGKKRLLGIPTLVDRVIQQAINQILTPIYEKQFSDNSFGFRPDRSTHDALKQLQKYLNERDYYCVDLDLKQFFDTVVHSKLITILQRTIKDNRVISLIHKYLNAGVMTRRGYESTTIGVPQGGSLSPLLANIMLNEMDKELEKRGHKFVRYADDCVILCKSRRASERIKKSITKFIENKLLLKVNTEKTVTGYIAGKKFLGYTFYKTKGKFRFCLHKKSALKLKRRLKQITKRNNGWGLERIKNELKLFISGWINYYKMADMKSFLKETDSWLKRRIRAYIWKCWKRVKTKFENLQKCKIPKGKAWEWANTRKKYWRIADSFILHRAIKTEWLKIAGYPTLMGYYIKLHKN